MEQLNVNMQYESMEKMMNDIVQRTIQNLSRNNMAGYYAHSIVQLHEIILFLIQQGDTVGCGDSVTLEQTGIFELMRSKNYTFLDKHQHGLSREEKREIVLITGQFEKDRIKVVFIEGAYGF